MNVLSLMTLCYQRLIRCAFLDMIGTSSCRRL